jgi:hypothetical protein
MEDINYYCRPEGRDKFEIFSGHPYRDPNAVAQMYARKIDSIENIVIEVALSEDGSNVLGVFTYNPSNN